MELQWDILWFLTNEGGERREEGTVLNERDVCDRFSNCCIIAPCILRLSRFGNGPTSSSRILGEYWYY